MAPTTRVSAGTRVMREGGEESRREGGSVPQMRARRSGWQPHRIRSTPHLSLSHAPCLRRAIPSCRAMFDQLQRHRRRTCTSSSGGTSLLRPDAVSPPRPTPENGAMAEDDGALFEMNDLGAPPTCPPRHPPIHVLARLRAYRTSTSTPQSHVSAEPANLKAVALFRRPSPVTTPLPFRCSPQAQQPTLRSHPH